MHDTQILPVASLGFVDRGWTRGHITARFPDMAGKPGFLEYGPLLLAVIEKIDAGSGYPRHRHEGIESILIPLSGAIAHEDSVGGSGETCTDEVAVLSAGSGIEHAEMARADQPARAVMFWVRSDEPTGAPRFVKRTFPRAARANQLLQVVGGDALPVRADVTVYTGVLTAGTRVVHELAPERRAYVLAPDGRIAIGGRVAQAGDRVLVRGPARIEITALDAAEVVLLDQP